MGFFKNPLKAHKKLAKAGTSATQSLAKAGVPKQSPARGLLGGGGGGAMRAPSQPAIPVGGAPPNTGPRRGPRVNDRPYLAEGGKVGYPMPSGGGRAKNKSGTKK